MSELTKCKREGCNPVQQTRGDMKPEDFHLGWMRHLAAKELIKLGVHVSFIEEFRRDIYDVEENEDGRDDLRVSCSKCGLASGWMRRDIEEYRRHGDGDYRRYVTVRDGNLDLVTQRWNEKVNGHSDK